MSADAAGGRKRVWFGMGFPVCDWVRQYRTAARFRERDVSKISLFVFCGLDSVGVVLIELRNEIAAFPCGVRGDRGIL